MELVIWRVPDPVRGSAHGLEYRLALVVDGVCVLRYDNEAGKGDHKHVGEREMPTTSPIWRPASGLLEGRGGLEDRTMRTVTLGVSSIEETQRQVAAAFSGEKVGEFFSFATVELLWKVLTAKRWDILKAMAGQGEMTVREIARRVDRDVKAGAWGRASATGCGRA